jgi:hypothetical protein
MSVGRRRGTETVWPIDQRRLIAIYQQLKALLAMLLPRLLVATLNRSYVRGLFVGATKG